MATDTCVAIQLQQVRGHKVPPLTDDVLTRVRAFLEAIPVAELDLCTSLKVAALRCLAPSDAEQM